MTLQAGTVLLFGIDTPLTNYGLVQKFSVDDSVQRTTAKAPDGAVVSIQEHNRQYSLSLTYIPVFAGSTDDNPQIGEKFEFDGSQWQVDNVQDIKTVDGFEGYEIEATYYPGVQ